MLNVIPKRLVSTKDITHDDWLEQRKNGLGGSDIAAILGLNPYRSAISVFLDKTGKSEVIEDNEAMRQGRELEDYVAKRFEEKSKKKVRRNNFILQHPEHYFMLANIDRWIVGENAGLECKTTNIFNYKAYQNEGAPAQYELQCMHYMAVTGADKWYLAVLVYGKDYLVFEYQRDEEMIDMIIQAEKHFWENYVLKNVMPPTDGSIDAENLIKNMYPTSSKDKKIELIGFSDKLKRYDELKELMSKLENEQEQIKQEIQMEMGDAEIAEAGDRTITWKNVTRNTFDTKNFQTKHKDLYNQFLKTTSQRRFLI